MLSGCAASGAIVRCVVSSVVFVPPCLVRERLAATEDTVTHYAPHVPRAPLVWGSAAELFAALGATLVILIILALTWAPIILATAWAYRRLHH